MTQLAQSFRSPVVHIHPLVQGEHSGLHQGMAGLLLDYDENQLMGIVLHAVPHFLLVGEVVGVLWVEPHQVLHLEIRRRNVHDLYVFPIHHDQRVPLALVLKSIQQLQLRTHVFQHFPVLAMQTIHVPRHNLTVTHLLHLFFKCLQFYQMLFPKQQVAVLLEEVVKARQHLSLSRTHEIEINFPTGFFAKLFDSALKH